MTLAEDAQVAADLRAAADELERNGWTRNDYGDVDGPKCIVGALNTATGSLPWISTDRALHARAVLFTLTGGIRWNDTVCQSREQAVAALRAAADAAEADRG